LTVLEVKTSIKGMQNGLLRQSPCKDRGGDPMHTVVAILMCSLLWLCPVMVEAGTPGTTGE
jgi:hypothetical protein